MSIYKRSAPAVSLKLEPNRLRRSDVRNEHEEEMLDENKTSLKNEPRNRGPWSAHSGYSSQGVASHEKRKRKTENCSFGQCEPRTFLVS